MKLIPVYDNLVVSLDPRNEKTLSGLFLPTDDKGYETGTIIACGPGSMHTTRVVACPFEAGQKVLFMRYKDMSLTVEGSPVVLLCYEDVLAIIEE
jgi:co-chaperonin GroES (HSP10)